MLVYLIQIDSEIMKVGMSSKTDLKRCYSYGASPKFLSIMEVGEDYLSAEKSIISAFKKNYEIAKGREYFLCSDRNKAKLLFLESLQPFIEEKKVNMFARFAFKQSV